MIIYALRIEFVTRAISLPNRNFIYILEIFRTSYFLQFSFAKLKTFIKIKYNSVPKGSSINHVIRGEVLPKIYVFLVQSIKMFRISKYKIKMSSQTLRLQIVFADVLKV